MLFAGTLVHRGGAHRGTRNAARHHAAVLRAVDPSDREHVRWRSRPTLARGYSERVQELLGYDIFEPTFVGYVDGMHPKRLIDPDYASRKQRRDQARAAEERAPREVTVSERSAVVAGVGASGGWGRRSRGASRAKASGSPCWGDRPRSSPRR